MVIFHSYVSLPEGMFDDQRLLLPFENCKTPPEERADHPSEAPAVFQSEFLVASICGGFYKWVCLKVLGIFPMK